MASRSIGFIAAQKSIQLHDSILHQANFQSFAPRKKSTHFANLRNHPRDHSGRFWGLHKNSSDNFGLNLKSWMNSVRYKGVRKITVSLHSPKLTIFFGPKRKGFVSNPSYFRCYRWSFRNPSMKPSPARMVNPNPTRTWPCQRPRKTWQGDLGPAMVGHYVFMWKMIL